MKTLEYPSKGFADAAMKLVDENEEFMVAVAKNEKKKKVLLQELAVLASGKDQQNVFVSVLHKIRIESFYSSVAGAILGGLYEMRYEDKGDLLIYLKPKKK